MGSFITETQMNKTVTTTKMNSSKESWDDKSGVFKEETAKQDQIKLKSKRAH